MKKNYTTKSGKNIVFWVEKNSRVIMASEGVGVEIVGWIEDEDEHHFVASDYHDELDIKANGDNFAEAFEAFCEAFVKRLDEREAKRAEFFEKLEHEIDLYKKQPIIVRWDSKIDDIFRLVNEAADDVDF